MMKNNKGLSTIVATLITILLVLVAVGIIWVVVRNVIEGGATQINSGAKCLDIDLKATKVLCSLNSPNDGGNSGLCNATISRNAGGEEIGGVKLIFYNEAGETNYIHTEEGNVAPLETKTINLISTGIVNASKLEVVAYFLDDSGNSQLCATTSSLKF